MLLLNDEFQAEKEAFEEAEKVRRAQEEEVVNCQELYE